jgi:hypothetical protein
LEGVGGRRLVELLPRELGDFLVDDEFGHCVWDSVLPISKTSQFNSIHSILPFD